jgi:hypothetical protein
MGLLVRMDCLSKWDRLLGDCLAVVTLVSDGARVFQSMGIVGGIEQGCKQEFVRWNAHISALPTASEPNRTQEHNEMIHDTFGQYNPGKFNSGKRVRADSSAGDRGHDR